MSDFTERIAFLKSLRELGVANFEDETFSVSFFGLSPEPILSKGTPTKEGERKVVGEDFGERCACGHWWEVDHPNGGCKFCVNCTEAHTAEEEDPPPDPMEEPEPIS